MLMLMLMVMAMVMVQASAAAAAKGFFKEHTLNGLSANALESLREPSAADKADLFASSGEEAGGERDRFSRMGLLTLQFKGCNFECVSWYALG